MAVLHQTVRSPEPAARPLSAVDYRVALVWKADQHHPIPVLHQTVGICSYCIISSAVDYRVERVTWWCGSLISPTL